MKGTIWCLHGAVGMAEDWKGFSVPGWAVKRVDLWRWTISRILDDRARSAMKMMD